MRASCASLSSKMACDTFNPHRRHLAQVLHGHQRGGVAYMQHTHVGIRESCLTLPGATVEQHPRFLCCLKQLYAAFALLRMAF